MKQNAKVKMITLNSSLKKNSEEYLTEGEKLSNFQGFGLSSYRNCEGPEVAQLQLRFCWLETSCEQDDHFPPNLMVRVNNRMAQLPVSSVALHSRKCLL